MGAVVTSSSPASGDHPPTTTPPGSDSAPAPAQGDASARFPVVGVGASAGGLAALSDFLKHLPLDTGMGFILIQHLAPDYPSQLTPLLQLNTRLPVVEASDGTTVLPDHVYVINPQESTQGSLSEATKAAQKRDNVQICRMSVSENADVEGLAQVIESFFDLKYGAPKC